MTRGCPKSQGGNKYFKLIKAWIKDHGGGVSIPFSIDFEEEINGFRENVRSRLHCMWVAIIS